MKITLINGSPKVKDSASGLILNELKIFLNNSEDEAERNISISEYNFRKFYEGEQNKLAIEIIENWSEKCELKWGQGIGIGAGPLLHSVKDVPEGHGPKKNLGSALTTISKNILNASSDDNIFISANFPRFAYKFAAEIGWKQAIKANKLKVRDLYIRK